MAQFRMLGGHHTDMESGKVYEFKKGRETIVESDKDLDVLFANQFERIGEKTKKAAKTPLGGGIDKHVMDDPEHVRRATVKRAAKQQAEALEEEEDVMEEEDRDAQPSEEMEKEAMKSSSAAAKRAKKQEEADEEAGGAEGEEAPDFGEDVTKHHAAAGKMDLRVFKGDKGYTVVDADDPTVSLNKGKTLKNRAAVDKFVKAYSKKE